MEELKKKNLAISFVLQGYSYSLPLEKLFEDGAKNGEMDFLIKFIDDEDAIWTLGYPFLNQFLMIFNMEENHVGIKKLKKTSLPIVEINSMKAPCDVDGDHAHLYIDPESKIERYIDSEYKQYHGLVRTPLLLDR